jgi:hypothetical protein
LVFGILKSYSSRDGIFANSPWIDENFNTGFGLKSQLPEKFIAALIPYHFHNRELTTELKN